MLAKGFMDEATLDLIHRYLETELGKTGAILDAIYYCPHHPEKGHSGEVTELKIKCHCRKPKTGMIEMARDRFNIELSSSYMIGDSSADYYTAQNAGLNFIGVKTGLGCKDFKSNPPSEFKRVDNLLQALDYLPT